MACNFDKTPTAGILTFDLVVILGSLGVVSWLSRLKDKIWQRLGLVAIGVFLFEFFTSPMWENAHLGIFAYVYQDVSWILTLGWSAMILTVVVLVDEYFKRLKAGPRFGLYLLFLTFLVLITESVVVGLGIRSYAPEVVAAFTGDKFLGVNVEVFYYVPVFMALVIGFYKYWSLWLDKAPVVPVKKKPWARNLLLTTIGVLLFELMIEPMVVNANLPEWSYIYRDVSLLMTGMWVVIIWVSTYAVDKLFIHWGLLRRFYLYLMVIGVFTLPIESWLIRNGYRIYGPSATANFMGFNTPISGIPVEVALAIPIYLALIIGFVRFWEIILDNKM